ncbi:MAG: SPFH domain-containing protein [Acetobacter sp.]|nr:SPFH domain-containing protein [Acetobacter sp.]
MALIDVIKCVMDGNNFCQKFPSEDLRLGTQLIVYSAQTAFFVKGGVICDEFSAGNYTLKTENIPILNKIINIPFGFKSPFQAEVWFVNHISKLDMKWGTPQPLQLEDPRYGVIVPVRAFGQYGIKITDARKFLQTLIGNMASFSAEQIDAYFRGKIVSSLNANISQKIAKDKISILDINANLMEMSEYCKMQIAQSMVQYGVELCDFTIMSINVPQDDPSIVKLKAAKDEMARINILGKDNYQMGRSFDVLDTVAGNTSAGGQMAAMGAGFGAGMGFGSAVGHMAGQTINTNPSSAPVPPPIPPQTTYFVYINGQQLAGQTPQMIVSLIAQGAVNGDTLVWSAGMPSWVKLSLVPELAQLLLAQTPPPIPTL